MRNNSSIGEGFEYLSLNGEGFAMLSLNGDVLQNLFLDWGGSACDFSAHEPFLSLSYGNTRCYCTHCGFGALVRRSPPSSPPCLFQTHHSDPRSRHTTHFSKEEKHGSCSRTTSRRDTLACGVTYSTEMPSGKRNKKNGALDLAAPTSRFQSPALAHKVKQKLL